jgi:hypothetical protein
MAGALALGLACTIFVAKADVAGGTSEPLVRQSLERGYWIVRPGDRLRAIARRFFPGDRARTNALRNALFERNPRAFLHGDPNSLITGAKLWLPSELAKEPPQTSAAAPSAAAPSSAPPRVAPAPKVRGDEPPPILERVAPAPSAPAYVDRLIDPGAAAEALGDAPLEEAPEPFGRRSLAIDLRTEWHDNGTRRIWEKGIGLNYRRETAQWGELGFEADLREAETRERSTDHSLGGKVTVYQYRLPLGGNWLADNSAGVLRSLAPNMVSSGFRVNLPAPLLWGAATSLYSADTRIYAQAGRGARLTGFSTQEVELDASRAGILGAERQVFPGLRLGAQANASRLEESQAWQSSVVVAAEAFSPETKTRLKLAVLGDDAGRKGFWLEGAAYQGFFHHQFGGYQFDRDVAYNAVPIVNDERLAYFRTDYRTQRLSYSLALDASQTNLDRNAARSGRDALAAFGSLNMRMSRTLTVGGSLNVRHEDPRTAAAIRKDVDAETAFLRLTSFMGTASFDLARASERGAGLPHENTVSLAWNHEWPAIYGINVTTSLSRAVENGAQGDTKRTVMGVTLRSFPASGIYLDLSLVRARIDRDAGREDNTNASLGATWQFLPAWQAQLIALWNTIETSAADLSNPTFRDKSVQLALRYQRANGIPIIPLGARQPGTAGTGRIFGRVFFDENDDGIRQPNERPAARVTLFLDGRYPVTTDSDGRFEFPLVTAGPHSIQVGIETIPLPWGLAEERSIPVAVPVRGDAVVDIPLKRVAP